MKGNVKRWFIFALLLCAAVLMGCVALGEEGNGKNVSENYTYPDITIPDRAYANCSLTDKTHDDLTISEWGVTNLTIGEAAFEGNCLKEIFLGACETISLGKHAYRNNPSLNSIYIAANPSFHDDDAAYDHHEVDINIGEGAFIGCSNLQEVSVGESWDTFSFSIGSNAFEGLKKLAYFGGNYAYSIGKYAFSGCENLEDVYFSVTGTIGKEAFKDCKSLTDYSAKWLLCKVQEIESGAFQNCTSLTTVILPENVKLWGDAFKGCTNLTIANITGNSASSNTKSNGDEGTIIGANVFEGCTSLTSIVLGDDIASIDENAFSGLSDDLLITFKGTAEQLKQLATGKLAELNWVSNDSKLYTKIAERTFEVGETISVDLSTDEAQKRILAASHFDWDVQPRGAVSVNSGKITFLQAGDITVTASLKTNSSIQLQLTFHVEGEPETIVPVARIRLKAAKREISLKKDGKKFKLTAKVFPANATNTQLSWSSSNRKIATVSRKGVVTFKKKGNVTITATSKSNPEVQASILFKVVK